MCGIYGYIGQNSVNKVFEGLKRLEYRGYDSAGIALVGKIKSQNYENVFSGDISVIKAKGELKILGGILSDVQPVSFCCIGHTRWATHGEPSIKNSHPHLSGDKKWAIVHNGIVENYQELKAEISSMLDSETDSEIIAHLLEKEYQGDTLKTIKRVCDKIIGSFALAIIHEQEPDRIYVARRNSPVVVGIDKNCGVICSDLGSMRDVKEAYMLSQDNFSVVRAGKVEIYNKNLKQIHLKNLVSFTNSKDEDLGRYKHFMQKEIDEIPTAIKNTVKAYTYQCFKRAIPSDLVNDTKNILIIGCGTAYHAGLLGKRLFEEIGIKSEAVIASEFRYSKFIFQPNTLAIFVSQSGETADTIKAVKLCKQKGIKTLAITNVKNSSLTFEVDYCLYTYAGAEIGVASTKAYDCQLAIFYLLTSFFSKSKLEFENARKSLLKCANLIKINKIKSLCQSIAKKLIKAKGIFVLGRGQDFTIAKESSLKIKEVSYISCEAIPAGELKHGTISLIEPSKYVLAFITENCIKEKTLSNINEVKSRGGKVIIFSQFNLEGDEIVKMPSVEEKYMPLIAIHYSQLIAYYSSVLLGYNPDKPRCLAKSVTVE